MQTIFDSPSSDQSALRGDRQSGRVPFGWFEATGENHLFRLEPPGRAVSWRKQVSLSLQMLNLAERRGVFLPADSYGHAAAAQPHAQFNRSDPPSRIEGTVGEADWQWFMRQGTAWTAPAKVVASFIGRVDSIQGTSATVLLLDEATGERLESRCDTDILQENGIGNGDQFCCQIVRARGSTATRLSKLPPKPLAKEQVDEIRASHSDRWNF